MTDEIKPMLDSVRYSKTDERHLYELNRMDDALSNLLCGEHTIMDHNELRVIQLAELRVVLDAAMSAAWQRHTQDCDFRLVFTMKDGKKYEVFNCFGEFLNSENKDWENFTACVQWRDTTHLQIEGTRYHHDIDRDEKEEEKLYKLPIRKIQTIEISEEH